MDTHTSPVFTKSLRNTGGNESVQRSGAEAADCRADGVVLRQLAEKGGFARTIKCLPGSVTVIKNGGNGERDEFREALLGERSGNAAVSIRDGARELHPSEVHIVGSAEYLFRESTVAGVLHAAGAPREYVEEILREIGLGDSGQRSPRDLPMGALRRLAAACAFFHKSRVIAFDRPFDDVQSDWVPILAKLILQGAEAGNRIVVVFGVDQMPEQWSEHPLVNSEGPRSDAAIEMRHMLQENRGAVAEQPYFVTRPLSIHKRVKPREDVLRAEQIPSPHLAALQAQKPAAEAFEEVLLADDAADADSGTAEAGGASVQSEKPVAASMRRQTTGKLTRVTSKQKLRRHPAIAKMRAALLKIYRMIFNREILTRERERAEALPYAAKIQTAIRAFELKVMLLILLFLMLLLLSIHLLRTAA